MRTRQSWLVELGKIAAFASISSPYFRANPFLGAAPMCPIFRPDLACRLALSMASIAQLWNLSKLRIELAP
jgi:hypothetical protein